jgi:hypothetical protein
MRWKGLVIGCAAGAMVGALPAQALTGAKPTRISVSPVSGRPSTTFTLRFTAPDRTGRFGGLDRRDELTVSGPANRKGCVDLASATFGSARAGARESAKLVPHRLGGRWCTGTFRGRIEEIGRPVCQPGKACPQFIVVLRKVGAFKFTVRRKPS